MPLTGPRDLSDAGKRSRIADRDVGQDLAIERHPSALEPGDQLGVGQAVLPRSCVEADDPQGPQLALALLAADIRIGHGVEQRLARRLDQRRLGAAPTLGGLEQTLVAPVGCYAALYSCHR